MRKFFSPEMLIPINRLLLIAQKNIAMKWLSPSAPSFEVWRLQVSDSLLKEQQIYRNRGTPNTFSKLWESWLAVPDLAPFSLVSFRLLQCG